MPLSCPQIARRLPQFALAALLVACAAPTAGEGSAPPTAAPAAQAPTAAPATATPPAHARPLQLISPGLRVVASSEYHPAELASDGDYGTEWRSQGVPATLAYDLAALPAAQRRRLLLAWYNGTYGYTTEMGCEGVGYNNLGAYTIDANPGQGGRTPPDEGWVTLVAVEGNTFHSRQHLLDLSGYAWVRLNATASHGSPKNEDVALNLDLYAADGSVEDGWIFFGDSITAGAMGHSPLDGPDGPVLSFAEQIRAATGEAFPPQENGGIPCITTDDLAPVFAEWVARFPGRFVAVSLGTNDAMAADPDEFYARYAAMVEAALQAGKVPVIPTIPWSPDGERQARTLELNAQIYRLYRNYPDVVRGPDLWAFFAERPELISDDQIHPSEAGYAAYRQVWAATMAERIYGAPSGAP